MAIKFIPQARHKVHVSLMPFVFLYFFPLQKWKVSKKGELLFQDPFEEFKKPQIKPHYIQLNLNRINVKNSCIEKIRLDT